MKNGKNFIINRGLDSERSVTAVLYALKGDYWVFYADQSQTKKILTIRASLVDTIDTVADDER